VCAPCNQGRWSAAPTALIFLGIIALTWIPVTLFTLSFRQYAGGTVALVVVFHMLLLLTLAAWLHAAFVDPGTPPEAWQREMSEAERRGERVNVCQRSGLYKPPRSHFDSVTKRLTLNMDHFCPWVLNTVGYYNRKFFILFLGYTVLTLFFAVLTLLLQLPAIWEWLGSDTAQSAWFDNPMNAAVFCGALALDSCLLVFLLPFFLVHLKMALRNETTIEGSRFPQFDVGGAANLAQVFGRSRWHWLCPCYCRGPDGDGIVWPTDGNGPLNELATSRAPLAERLNRRFPPGSTFQSAAEARAYVAQQHKEVQAEFLAERDDEAL
jgi:palmitoyltransferase